MIFSIRYLYANRDFPQTSNCLVFAAFHSKSSPPFSGGGSIYDLNYKSWEMARSRGGSREASYKGNNVGYRLVTVARAILLLALPGKCWNAIDDDASCILLVF